MKKQDRKFKRPMNVKKFIKKEFPMSNSIWGKGLLEAKSKLIVSGPGKIGKSFFVLNLAISLATGEEFLGFHVSEKKRILFVQQEISEHNLQKRLKAMLRGLDKTDEISLDIVTPKGLNICEEDDFSKLVEWIKQGEYEIVIFDPLYKLHSSDENSAQEMKKVVDIFDLLINRLSISVVIVHHHNKSSGYSNMSQKLRGSSVLHDWGDSYAFLVELGKVESGVQVSWKLRNAQSPEELTINLSDDLWWEINMSEKNKNVLRIQTMLDKVKWTKQKRVTSKLKAIADIEASTVRNYLKVLMKRGLVETQLKKNRRMYRLKANTPN